MACRPGEDDCHQNEGLSLCTERGDNSPHEWPPCDVIPANSLICLWGKIQQRLITPVTVRVELCTDAQKNIVNRRLGFGGSKWTVLLATRRSMLLLGSVGRAVARLVEAGLLSVVAGGLGTGSGYTTTSAACVSSSRMEEPPELQMEWPRLISPGEE